MTYGTSRDPLFDAETGSRTIEAGGLSWGIEWRGAGPDALFLHGTGATRQSWRWLMPLLTPHARCISIDLPGHGETSSPGFSRITLDSMAALVAALMERLAIDPALVVAHSAGGAIMLQLAATGRLSPSALLVGINPALQPPHPAARLAMASPFGDLLRSRAVRGFVREAGQFGAVIELLLASTGSRLTEEQELEYRRAFHRPDHAEAAYAMMANWDLGPLARALRTVGQRTLFIVGERDQWVPPRVSVDAAAHMTSARVVRIPNAGHLVHEERPDAVASAILGEMSNATVPPTPEPAVRQEES